MAVSLLSLDVIVPSVAIQYDTKETVSALRWGAQQVAEAARRIIRPRSRSKKMKRQGSLPGEAPVSLTG